MTSSPRAPASLGPTPSMLSTAAPAKSVLTLVENAAAAPADRLKACRELMETGRFGRAIRLLAGLLDDPAARAEAQGLIAACRELRAHDVGTGGLVEPVAESDGRGYFYVSRGSDVTAMVFTGRARRVGVSVVLMQRLLEPLGCNIVVLYDWRDALYLGGVAGLGRGVGDTARALARLSRSLGASRIVCVGQSTGGYGALRYGLELGAESVLAFSPLIRRPLNPRRREALSLRAGRPLDEAEVNLRQLWAQSRITPRTTIVHGADNANDRRAAEELSARPGVTVRPLEGVGEHGVIQVLLARGAFGAALGDGLGLSPQVRSAQATESA